MTAPAPLASGTNDVIRRALAKVVAGWRWIAIWVIALTAAVGIFVLLSPRQYLTVVQFLPETASAQQLSSLAAQFGIEAGGGGAESPYYYVELLKTDDILLGVVRKKFPTGRSASDSATLAEVLRIRNKSLAVREQLTLRALKERMTAASERRTGIVTLTVTMGTPVLSAAVATAAVNAITEFNTERRQRKARAERAFVQQRVAQARMELAVAEDSMMRFLETNRAFRTSPELVFENDRLTRAVTLKATILTGLLQSFERARIDEVRDTPQISILNPARVPAEPVGRGLVVKVVGTAVAAVVPWLALVFCFQWLLANAAADHTVRRLLHLWATRYTRGWSLASRALDPPTSN
jgi:uncharacterized protein involved in exopolysaccharide biosynthesis